MAINPKLLARTMFDAARPLIADDAMDVRELLQMQLRTLANVACDIEQLHRSGKIDKERARLLFEMHRTATRAALTTVEKIGVTTAERLLTAAIGALGEAALSALGLRSPAAAVVRASFKAGKDL
jgi:hypothetical protein